MKIVTSKLQLVSDISFNVEVGCTEQGLDARPPATYYTSIPPPADRSMRRFDTGKLKEVRKKLDSGQCRQDEIDEITKDLMEDCAEVGICAI